MIDYLLNICNENKKGLYLIEQPTGSGKTFSIAKSIYRYIIEGGENKIIYLTSQNKNVDDMYKTIKSIFNYDEFVDDMTIRIENNIDCVVKRLNDLEIPEIFRTEHYYNLLADIQLYKDNPKDKDVNKSINDDEKKFRTSIKEIFYKHIKKGNVFELVKNDERFKWIGELYPSVYTLKKQIILTTISKFNYKNTSVLYDDYDFIEESFLKDATIIIDEFDASKEMIKNVIIKKSKSLDIEKVRNSQHIIKNYYKTGFFIPNKYNLFKGRDFIVDESPENVLLRMCKLATVIGVSATAEVDTVIGNYNLKYLKENLGDNNFHRTPESLRKKIETEYALRNTHYKQIDVECDVLKSNNNLMDYLSSFLDEDKASKIFDLISSLKQDTYINTRYANMARVFNIFVERNDINSLLCFNSVLPKSSDLKFKSSTIKEIWKIITDSNDNIKLYFLETKNFDKNKDKLIKDLTDGKKCLAMSTYNTIGAGQNLQYAIPNDKDIVYISEYNEYDERFKKKDFDAVYFGDCTNLTLNTIDSTITKTETDLYKSIIQILELYYNLELEKKEAANVKDEYLAYFAGKVDKVEGLHNMASVVNQATRAFLQAIGRINRTFCKNKNILLLIDENLFKKLNTEEISKRAYTYELRVVLDKLKQRDKSK